MTGAVGGGLPDIIAENLAVLFCGINPGMTAAASGHHFAGRASRFLRVMHLAGITPEEVRPEEDRRILDYGCGLTTVVKRPTASADQLSPQEFAAVAAAFKRKIARFAPRVVAFLGKPVYSALSGRREYRVGTTGRDDGRVRDLGVAQSQRTEPRFPSRSAGGGLQ
jgi:TDG/mug DNA glycosylase family protein